MKRRIGWLGAARVLAVTLLAVVIMLMVTSRGSSERVGPFPTGDGDAVTVTPRALP